MVILDIFFRLIMAKRRRKKNSTDFTYHLRIYLSSHRLLLSQSFALGMGKILNT